MKIAVCVKQVPVSENVEVDPVTHNLIREHTENDINPADLNALACALAVRQQTECQIDVFTMGPTAAEKALRKAIAMGADRAFLISDRVFAGGDTLMTAKVLAEALKYVDTYDLVLTGSESSDGATGQVGPMLASLLQMPDVADAVDIQITKGQKADIKQKTGKRSAVLEADLPVLLAVPFGCNEPVLPTLRSQMNARKKEITVIDNSSLHLAEEQIGIRGSLSVVVDILPVKREKTAKLLEGTLSEITEQIYDFIKRGGV